MTLACFYVHWCTIYGITCAVSKKITIIEANTHVVLKLLCCLQLVVTHGSLAAYYTREFFLGVIGRKLHLISGSFSVIEHTCIRRVPFTPRNTHCIFVNAFVYMVRKCGLL